MNSMKGIVRSSRTPSSLPPFRRSLTICCVQVVPQRGYPVMNTSSGRTEKVLSFSQRSSPMLKKSLPLTSTNAGAGSEDIVIELPLTCLVEECKLKYELVRSELTTGGYYGMYLTALIIDCVIARLYSPAKNKSVKLRPGTTEWNQTCYRDYTLNCNGEFLEKDCSSAEIATCLGALSYCRLKRAPLNVQSAYKRGCTGTGNFLTSHNFDATPAG